MEAIVYSDIVIIKAHNETEVDLGFKKTLDVFCQVFCESIFLPKTAIRMKEKLQLLLRQVIMEMIKRGIPVLSNDGKRIWYIYHQEGSDRLDKEGPYVDPTTFQLVFYQLDRSLEQEAKDPLISKKLERWFFESLDFQSQLKIITRIAPTIDCTDSILVSYRHSYENFGQDGPMDYDAIRLFDKSDEDDEEEDLDEDEHDENYWGPYKDGPTDIWKDVNDCKSYVQKELEKH